MSSFSAAVCAACAACAAFAGAAGAAGDFVAWPNAVAEIQSAANANTTNRFERRFIWAPFDIRLCLEFGTVPQIYDSARNWKTNPSPEGRGWCEAPGEGCKDPCLCSCSCFSLSVLRGSDQCS